MRTLIVILSMLGTAMAAEKELKPLKPIEELKPIDEREIVRICGKSGCTSMPVNDLLRRIERERSGGGDIIGNGGGLAEQNFTYALTHLADFISETLKEGLVKGVDAENLKKIAHAARAEGQKAEKLVFLSGRNNPGIFTAENDPEVRLAKTGLTQEAPIFINLDLLYSKQGDVTEMLPLPIMVASLVHELGHQVGMTDHTYLDFLGARVRRMVEREYTRSAKNLDGKTRIEMISINLGAFSMPRLSLMIKDTLVPLEKELFDTLKCRSDLRPRAARLSNQHWERPQDFNGHWIAPYRAWAELTCVNGMGQVEIEERDLVLDLSIDLTGEKAPAVEVIQFNVQN